MKNTLLSILFFLISFLQNGISQEEIAVVLKDIPLVKHFESTDVKGGIQSWSFDQDSSGILYVANNDGLLEFDGSKWTKYEVPFSTRLRAVKVDSQNRIFVGGQGQIGFFSMSKTGLQFSSLLEYLPEDLQNIAEIWKIIEIGKHIYFVTESRLIVYADSTLKVLPIPGYLRLAFKVDEKIIIQIYNEGLYELKGDNFIHIEGTANLSEFISVLSKTDGYHYFSRSGNIYSHDKFGINQLDIQVELGMINDVIKMRSGEFVVGTQNKGLYFFNPDFSFKQHLTKNEGLSDRTVKSLYEDEFNNLWVGLNNGIDYLEMSLPLSLINDQVGLDGTGYAACLFNNHIYLGTNNGLFIEKLSDQNFYDRRYEIVLGSEGQVYNFSKINNELILNHNKGAFQVEENEIKQFHDIGSWKFIQTPMPGLIIGGDYQGISFFMKKNDIWSKIRSIHGFNESSRIIEFENDSTLWMTHGTKGAYRLLFDDKMNAKAPIDRFGKNDGFPSDNFISIYSLNDKLVFTSEKGIFDFSFNSFTFNPNRFFNKWLGTKHVSSITSNGSNTIYFIQDQKFGMLTQETFGTYRIDTGLFKRVNKFINDDLPNISILDDRNVLIGAKEGFIKYDPQKVFSINKDFHILLRSVEIASPADSSISFSPSLIENLEITNNQSIKFQYAAPYFDGFEDIKYSYRLLPLDETWSKWTTIGEKDFPYLPSGEYMYEVKATNVYGLESPVVSFSFKVLPPWYYSSWAILIYLFLGLISLTLIPILQRKRHRTEKSIIVRSKDQELKIKNEEIHQISKDSKSEIDKLLNEKLRTEIDLKNDQLTTITMHLMNKSEFLQDVRKKIEMNLTQDGDKQDLRGIIKTIDDNLSNNDSWDQFAYHFDQVHGDYLKKLSKSNIKLTPREIKLAAFLRMNMSSKEISSLMNITDRSVELARHRLRKKLKLNRDQNLVEYLIELDNNSTEN